MVLVRFSAVATRIDLINVGAVSRAWHAGARLLLKSLTFTITAQQVASGDHVIMLRRLARIRNARIKLAGGTYNFSGVHGEPKQCEPSGNRGDPGDYVPFAELDEDDQYTYAPNMKGDGVLDALEQSNRLFLPGAYEADIFQDTEVNEEDSDGNWLPEWTWKPGFGPLSIAAGVTIEAARARALRSDGPVLAAGGPYEDVTIAHVNHNGEELSMSYDDLASFRRLRIDQSGVRLVGVTIRGGCDVSKRADLTAFCCVIGPHYEVGVTDAFAVCRNAISVQGMLAATRCNLNGAADTSIEVGKTAVVDVHSCKLFFGNGGELPEHGVSGIAGSSDPYDDGDIPSTATVNRTPIVRVRKSSICNDEDNWKGWACGICERDLKEYEGTLRVFQGYGNGDVIENARVCDECWVEPKGDDDWYKFFDFYGCSEEVPEIKSDFDKMLMKVAEAHCSSAWGEDYYVQRHGGKKDLMDRILYHFAEHRCVAVKHDVHSRICDCYWCMNARCTASGCIRCNPL